MPRTPIVFVPGIFGSFHLPVLLDWRGPTLSGWGFPPFADYGKGFLAAFQRAGYVRDRDLFVAFYDWRKTVQDSAQNYLIPWIDRARSRSGSSKVILVGHSMGGLVARSYIQSSGYRGDVERLITLGTPHRGSAQAYFTWGGGDVRSEGFMKAVFDVYLWYLEHTNPAMSGLNRLRTVRTLIPAVRDLLPIDDYLIDSSAPNSHKPENSLRERNLWGDLLNRPEGLNTLFGRVPVTVLSSVGFATVHDIVVKSQDGNPGDPPLFPDGVVVEEQSDGNGDSTVPLPSATLGDGRARNHPAVHVPHHEMADRQPVLEQIFAELGLAFPVVLGASEEAVASPARLVILSAAPIELTATLAQGKGRKGRLRAKNYGHSGQGLHMLIIENPDPSQQYDVQVQGTATGKVALGAVLVGGAAPTVLGTAGNGTAAAAGAAASAITTVGGQVAAGTNLHYRVSLPSLGAAPAVEFDRAATTSDLLARLGATPAAGGTAVLGVGGDVSTLAAQIEATGDPALAAALAVQLHQIGAGS
ncbi:MAG: permease [Chloroflexaceae bacterium]|jgi:pimeloyl-ACP methyl ester carboxylesterase|nr:permease [Chloroflexaceae bacterium]